MTNDRGFLLFTNKEGRERKRERKKKPKAAFNKKKKGSPSFKLKKKKNKGLEIFGRKGGKVFFLPVILHVRNLRQ